MTEENQQGKVIVIVAPSGSGKSTIANKLIEDYSKIKFSVSATTRKPRKGEIDGKEYFFLTEEEFKDQIEKNNFLEWEFYNNKRYGTLRKEVDKLKKSGYFPLLDIEVKGALNVKQLYDDDCVAIFIQPPSLEELKQRLLNRGTDTEESVRRRLKIAEKEMKYADRFDYVVLNDDLETAYNEVKDIVEQFLNENNG